MKIKDIYYTLQGEGRNWGMPAVFVRVGNCNLRCSFCDTDFLTSLKEMSVSEVVEEIKRAAEKCRNIVFTGGEPLLQQEELVTVMEILKRYDKNWYFAVETNGTIEPSQDFIENIDWICCSPKVIKDIKIKKCSEVKVVFTKAYQKYLDYFGSIEALFYYLSPEAPSNNPYTKSILTHMPYMLTIDDQIKEIIEFIKENPKWRLNLQTHKIINIP